MFEGFGDRPHHERDRYPAENDADQAARTICDGLERGRTTIVFPLRMALAMAVARRVPTRLWTALWAHTSVSDTRATTSRGLENP